MNFALRLKRIRLERGLSQASLARLCGIVQPNLAAMEQCRRQPSLASLRRLADALGCPQARLLDDDSPGHGLDRFAQDDLCRRLVGGKDAPESLEPRVWNDLKAVFHGKLKAILPGLKLRKPRLSARAAQSRLNARLGPDGFAALCARLDKAYPLMNFAQAERFFAALGRELPFKTVIVLTGGIAAGIFADPRVTDDIDFALTRPSGKNLAEVEAVVARVAEKHGVVLQYSADIDRWSSVTYLDWKKHTRPYRTNGALEIRILDPLYWSIGKIVRGAETDVLDLAAVFKAQRVEWLPVLKLWARALRKSPASTALINAKKQMQRFIREFGPRVWGEDFDGAGALERFERFLSRRAA